MTFLCYKEIAARWGLATKTIQRLRRLRDFPKPFKLTKRILRWRLADIERFEIKRGKQ